MEDDLGAPLQLYHHALPDAGERKSEWFLPCSFAQCIQALSCFFLRRSLRKCAHKSVTIIATMVGTKESHKFGYVLPEIMPAL